MNDYNRKGFELWASTCPWIKDIQRNKNYTTGELGDYQHYDTLRAWEVWKTAVAPLEKTINQLTKELHDADRRAGAAEREMEYLKEDALNRDSWLRKAKQQWGVDYNVSFDVVWAQALALKARPNGIDTEVLREQFASKCTGSYWCNRVWNAWNVGTMSEEDFHPLEETEFPDELVEIVIDHISNQLQETSNENV